MPVSRRTFLMTAGASIAAPAVLRVTRANAAEVTLRLHHFLPPVASVPKHMLEPWAKRIEDGTGGRLKIELYPSMQLGGTPPQLYDQAKDGVADTTLDCDGGSSPGAADSADLDLLDPDPLGCESVTRG